MSRYQTNRLLWGVLVLTALVYWTGLSGPFHFDDTWNILNNASLKLDSLELRAVYAAADSGSAGPLGRPLAMLSFAVDHYFASGFDPFFFKLTNLIIHLLCGVVVYFLTRSLALRLPAVSSNSTQTIAFLTCALWLLAPINLSPVLYVVQRMTSLSALFCFIGLLVFVKGRIRINEAKPHAWPMMLAAFVVFFPLGLLSKESAALLPLYCLVIEAVFFGFSAPIKRDRVLLWSLFSVLVFLPFIVVSVYSLFAPGWFLNGYAIRDFTLAERLMTEARVLLFYLGQIVLPMNSELGLFHDDIAISRSLFEPVSTAVSIAAILGLLVSARVLIKRFPVYAFAVLFFFSAHLIESTVIALELVHEHRNYVASFSVLFFVAYGVIVLSSRFSSRFMLPIFCASLVVWYAGTTFIRGDTWGNENIHAFSEVLNHPDSPRSNYQVGRLFASAVSKAEAQQKPQFIDKAVHYFAKSAQVSSSYTDGLFGLLMLDGIEGVDMGTSMRSELNKRLASGPFNHNNYNYLGAYFRCISSGTCKVKFEQVQQLITSCKSNPLFRGKHKDQVLDRFERYQRESTR